MVKITIHMARQVVIIIDVIVRYQNLLNFLVSDEGSFFISKFWIMLCFFLCVKQKLFTIFSVQTNSLIEMENSTVKFHLCVLVNWMQNDRARVLSNAQFAYNHAQNMSTSYMGFELNYRNHFGLFCRDRVNPCLRFRSVNKLAKRLKKLIFICEQNRLHSQE